MFSSSSVGWTIWTLTWVSVAATASGCEIGSTPTLASWLSLPHAANDCKVGSVHWAIWRASSVSCGPFFVPNWPKSVTALPSRFPHRPRALPSSGSWTRTQTFIAPSATECASTTRPLGDLTFHLEQSVRTPVSSASWRTLLRQLTSRPASVRKPPSKMALTASVRSSLQLRKTLLSGVMRTRSEPRRTTTALAAIISEPSLSTSMSATTASFSSASTLP